MRKKILDMNSGQVNLSKKFYFADASIPVSYTNKHDMA